MNMIDKIAAAIVPTTCGPFEAKPHAEKKAYRQAAVRALEAMREPTETMMDEVVSTVTFDLDEGETAAYGEIWDCMIDAAISDTNKCPRGDRT